MGKRELVALLSLSSWCLVMVVWLFLAMPWICLRFVIMVFPDHTHLLLFKSIMFLNQFSSFIGICIGRSLFEHVFLFEPYMLLHQLDLSGFLTVCDLDLEK